MDPLTNKIERVLVVEDDAAHARLIEIALRDCGISAVWRAADAVRGLRMVQDRVVDLLVCDLNLPGQDGISFLLELSQLPSPPPVVILSGADQALISTVEKLARATGLVILAALRKPLDMEVLQALLMRVNTASRPGADQIVLDQQARLVSDALLDDGLQQGWFVPYIEPKVDRVDGHVVGFELLARLCPPGLDVISPAWFIQRFEDSGQIEQMTWQIAEQGLRFAGDCQRADLPMTVALNLSPRMLGCRQLVGRLEELVRKQQLDVGTVTLEITESAAIGAGGVELENLARLRLRGFGLSIDDFGTGHSSLAQLSRVPFTEMKIDRLFSAAAPTDPRARAVAASCIELAGRMDMKSCAEGVESGEVFRLLYDLGAGTFQGYMFRAPMPCGEFLAWAGDWNRRVSIRDLYLDATIS